MATGASMGREMQCKCDWAGTSAEVRVLLEPGEMILRSGLRKRLPITEIKGVKALAGILCFKVGGEPVRLFLGEGPAEKWAKSIVAPPPSLARKLGITENMIVRTIGCIQDQALEEAIAETKQVSAKDAELIVACVETPESLDATLEAAKAQLLKDVPIWIVYAKGSGHPLHEAAIRSFLRDHGMMDTKVASVSAKLTALRFNRRNSDQLK